MKTQKKYTATQWQMRHMLNDVVEHFSKDPEGLRSVSVTDRCLYSPPLSKPKSIGCAIGMYLPETVCRKLDGRYNTSIGSICKSRKDKKELPKWMIKIDSAFLARLQDLHDDEEAWTEKSISKRGQNKVNNIIDTFILPKTIYG